jgi:hypothetical protein
MSDDVRTRCRGFRVSSSAHLMYGEAATVHTSVPKLRLTRCLSKGAFGVWAVVLFVAATSLMAAHLYALPKPQAADRSMQRAVNGLRSSAEADHWLVVHVLYAQCRCSRRILDHLAKSDRPPGVSEKLLLVGTLPELEPRLRELSGRGFDIVNVTSTELRDRFHVQAAPLLLVLAPDGAVRYAGGYTDRKQGLDVRDTAIVRELIANGTARELPLFGCAVSKELQRLLDPLALKTIPNP